MIYVDLIIPTRRVKRNLRFYIHYRDVDKTSKRQPRYAEVWRKTHLQCMGNKFRSALLQTVYTLPLFYAFWFNAPCQWPLLKLRPIISVQHLSAGCALSLTPTHSIISYENIIFDLGVTHLLPLWNTTMAQNKGLVYLSMFKVFVISRG
jgi:hypothetical protein